MRSRDTEKEEIISFECLLCARHWTSLKRYGGWGEYPAARSAWHIPRDQIGLDSRKASDSAKGRNNTELPGLGVVTGYFV